MSKKHNDLYWVEINLGAIKANLRAIGRLLGPETRMFFVVKSNAYGHGMLECARAAREAGVEDFAVVTLQEALELKKSMAKGTILILGFVPHELYGEAIEKGISFAIYDYAGAKAASIQAGKLQKKAKVHLKIDTGLGRLGVPAEHFPDFVSRVCGLENLEIEGIFTHYADAESPDSPYTLEQTERFKAALDILKKKGVDVPIVHSAGSAATMLMPYTRFTGVRVGIAAYGLWPSNETRTIAGTMRLTRNLVLEPALSFKTRIIQIKELEQGAYVGYGCTFRANQRIKTAVMPVGYAEGFPRALSNKGWVLVRGRRVPVIGRVCMNMTVLNVSDVEDVRAGDEVVIIGRQGSEEITADEFAGWTGTINYEVTTTIPPRVPRHFITD